MKIYIAILICLIGGFFIPLSAQEQNSTLVDSLTAVSDSMVRELTSQVQELQLQRIMLQEQLERSGQNARMDSIAKVQRQQRIDSLRKVTTGSPLIVEDDTLLVLYARKGGMLPEARVKEAREIIEMLAHKLVFKADTLYTFEGEYSTDIMADNTVVMSITDTDGLWQGKPRSQLAGEYMAVIQKKIVELHETYGLQKKLLRLFFAVLLIVVQLILIKLTVWLFDRWRSKVMHRVMDWIKPIRIKDYELLDVHRQGLAVMFIYNSFPVAYLGASFVLYLSRD